MPITLAVDFGSTYTKVAAIDCDDERLVGRAQSPTTVAAGVMLGLGRALALLEADCGVRRGDFGLRLASSSAAGGLRVVAIGLVPDLTAEAARRAALGAGARVQRVFAYELSRGDLREIARIAPDLILLCGGTDGGERKTIVRNASALAAAGLRAPVVVAGNRSAADEVQAVLQAASMDFTIVGNVLPELDRLDVEPARAAIRSVFMNRIAQAKGLDQAEAYVGRIVMPTPMAVLEGARLLAGEGGMGDIVVVDVGGATTDIHSIASGLPSTPGLVPRGLPEPFAKRTVEGDLGIRVNAPAIVEAAGAARVAALAGGQWTPQTVMDHVQRLAREVGHVPDTAAEHALDAALARVAVDTALERHAGQVTTTYTPMGAVQLLHGKDLGAVPTVIGTGGVLVHGRHPRRVLEAARYSAASPTSLRPRAPALLIDRSYLLFAAGLLTPVAPLAVSRLLRRHLLAAEESPHAH
ncbi:MAG: methylaspartate mutase accessory protein GlmL [Burkholderiaceae bacterium]|nr:methylaspartate mutase accessory protein GlmL [Burkholderiaceae bacterium]